MLGGSFNGKHGSATPEYSAASAVVFEISDDCADFHMYAFFLKQLLKEQVFNQNLGSDHDENDTAQDAGIAF